MRFDGCRDPSQVYIYMGCTVVHFLGLMLSLYLWSFRSSSCSLYFSKNQSTLIV